MKHWIETLRKKYGLQQDELAVYLNTSRTTLAMAETNKRDLPAEAMLLLQPLLRGNDTALSGELAQQLAQKQQADAEELAQQTAKLLQESKAALARARKKLATMQQKQQQALAALQLVERLKETPVPEPHQLRQAVFINQLLANAWASLSSNSATAQAAVQHTIRMHEAIVGEGEEFS